MFVDPQRLRVTKATPVVELSGMAFVNPSLTADTNRSSVYFFPLSIASEGQEKEMFSIQKTLETIRDTVIKVEEDVKYIRQNGR